MSLEQDCLPNLVLNEDGFVIGIEDCMHASSKPAIFQIRELLPGIKEVFPDASGVIYQGKYRIDLKGKILESGIPTETFTKPTESELAAMHNLSPEQYKTLLQMMDSPMNELPSEIISELAGKVGSLDGADEAITNWLKKQESDKE